jgi:pyruvate/2-oxoglutarate dehydrogenase complex dihydrolipoamide dehydrogenase (E3) component
MPDAFLTGNGIDLVIDAVVGIDKEKKSVRTAGGRTIGYDRLVIATGALPAPLPIPGIEKRNVYVIRKYVSYLQGMLDRVNAARDIVILGGGFVGADFADECKKNATSTSPSWRKLPHCLQLAFDDEFCEEAESVLTNGGVKIAANRTVARILGDAIVSAVELDNGEKIRADVVIVSIGVAPNTELAAGAGMRISRSTGGIMVDRYQRVLDERDIFACGDCSIKVSYFSGKPVKTWLASIATGEARLAAANLFETRYLGLGTVGVFSTQIGDLAVGVAGLTERQALQEGYHVVTGAAKAPSKHPGGMPGAVPTSLKLVFSHENGVILGGQVSGGATVGEMANVISACIQHRMTAYEVSLFQMGTHPALCASPVSYQVVNAAEDAVMKLR